MVRVPPHIGLGEIRIGFGDVGIFDDKRSRTVWDVLGEVHFKGRCLIGHGSKISVGGALFFGQDVHITAETQIVARKKVVLEDGVLISWDCLITDSDYHLIRNREGVIVNQDEEIIIEKDVWIGARCLILKGCRIPPGVVVAAGSTVTRRSQIEPKALVAGSPALIVKRRDITWQL